MDAVWNILWLVALGGVWLVPGVICLMKAKPVPGLIGLLGPVVATVVAVAVAIGWFAAFEDGPGDSGYAELGVLLYALIAGAGVWLLVVLGSILTAVIGAIRLARPTSSWARNYDESKQARARARFG